MQIPTITALSSLFNSPENYDTFLLENEIIYRNINCENCNEPMTRGATRFRCLKRTCRTEKSLYHESFFAGSKLTPCQIMLIGYLWISKTPFDLACIFTGHSRETISSFYAHYRQLVIDNLDEDDAVIGGPGIIVEIDESKFSKRKYNRGHRVEGSWVLGGVERTETRKVFAVIVPDRSASTLLDVISRHVKEGSIIYTDLWKGYKQLNTELGLEHFTVNHTLHFKDPDSGVHTNTIEGSWNGMKLAIARRARNSECLQERLLEFIWRRKNIGGLWSALLVAMKSIKYI